MDGDTIYSGSAQKVGLCPLECCISLIFQDIIGVLPWIFYFRDLGEMDNPREKGEKLWGVCYFLCSCYECDSLSIRKFSLYIGLFPCTKIVVIIK